MKKMIFLFLLVSFGFAENEKSLENYLESQRKSKEHEEIKKLQEYINLNFDIKKVKNCNDVKYKLRIETKGNKIFFYKEEKIEDEYINNFILNESGKEHDFLKDSNFLNNTYFIICN